MTEWVDLRSDTVTQPTEAMYECMLKAPLGDDGLDGDPTAEELESGVATLLGKEAALFVPSATMGNLAAILAQTARQELVVTEASSHIYTAERGAATLTGAFYEPIAGAAGAMNLELLERMERQTTFAMRFACHVSLPLHRRPPEWLLVAGQPPQRLLCPAFPWLTAAWFSPLPQTPPV